jgi:hypothetical protein
MYIYYSKISFTVKYVPAYYKIKTGVEDLEISVKVSISTVHISQPTTMDL